MKVKVISRDEEAYTRERPQDLMRVQRNPDPALHPFAAATEYTRALNAVKLERVFAKPFVGALGGHADGVTALATNPRSLTACLSAAADGEVRLWDVTTRRTLRRLVGHAGSVHGLCFGPDGETAVSCGDDCSVRLWRAPGAALGEVRANGGDADGGALEAAVAYYGRAAFRDVDHHWKAPRFATAGVGVDLWDHDRSEPVHSFSWGSDTVTAVRFNPAEPDIFASCGSDRSIALYDVRTSTPLRKLVMMNRCNKVAWNPREAFNFTVANEDCCLYTYDMRRLDAARCIHKDFVSAVMDVHYSPTGRELVAGSYDRTVRIFAHNGGHSRDVYHTKRMQRVFAVRFSGDGAYVLSGSDDMNVRVWKARASEQMGQLLPREKKRHAYNAALVERYKDLPEIKRIKRHRNVPTAVHKASSLRRKMQESQRRKRQNVEAHSAPGSIKHTPARKERVLAQVE